MFEDDLPKRKIGVLTPLPVIDNGAYGPEITDYLAKKGASWVAWCFDPEWGPMLIKDWDFTPTESGEYFRKVMLERKAKAAEAH